MLKFKEGVKGFVFDSSNDEITKVFNRVLSADEAILISEVINDDSILFKEEEVVMMVFDNVNCKEELGVLEEVMDWVD
jgi:hypothetical protein